MYFKKCHISICFLLIISLLLCGMCFETIQTDSSFVYSTSARPSGNASSVSILRSPYRTFSSGQVYSSETLGQRGIAAQIRQSDRRSIIKIGRSSYYPLWSAIPTPQSFSASWGNRAPASLYTVHSNTVILGYIHRQDGQKSNSLI